MSRTLPLGRFLGHLATAALLPVSLLACSDSGDTSQSKNALEPGARRATWAVSPQDYSEVFPGGVFPAPMPMMFSNQSLRQIVHVSVGGSNPRVHLSNLFGSTPLALGGVHLALAGAGSAIVAGTDTELRFGGQTSVTIPPGQEVWSDPGTLEIPAAANVAITLFVPGTAAVSTVHSVAQQTEFVTAGTALTAASFDAAETRNSNYWLTGLDVTAPAAGGVIVAFGDSITDGVGSTSDANHRYPNYLAERLRADPSLAGFGVADEGISGNRVLHDVAGPNALGRFQRDVLGQTGATHVLILIGINDLGFSGLAPDQAVTADDVIGGLSTLISQAKGGGLHVSLATLTPLKGTMAPYYSDQTEAARGTINTWIRNEADVDAVVDFDQAVQSSADPLAMNPDFDSSDHLHPNDAGYQAMANAIDLSVFR
jgi:lysophospholipase L1-like esterase